MSDKIIFVEDNVLFRMPASREYQFAAMAVIQSFIAGYDDKMKINHLLPTTNMQFRLHYAFDMPDDDLAFFTAIGLELKQEPEVLIKPDMELDFSEDRAMQFYAFDRHLCAIYGAMCGIQTNPTPKVRAVKPALTRKILSTEEDIIAQEVLMHVQDDEISCVIGPQSWLTYWSVAMGLPTIEIINERTKRAWLSKWVSPVYRMLETTSMDMLDQAIVDLEEVVAFVRSHEKKEAEA